MYESINSYETVNKCTKLFETGRFIKSYGNVRLRTFSYIPVVNYKC